MKPHLLVLLAVLQLNFTIASAAEPSPGDAMLADYFKSETAKLQQASLADIDSLEDWQAKRPELHRQLAEMLGLDPLPERTPLNAKITDTTDADGIVIERLYFESRPGTLRHRQLLSSQRTGRSAAGDSVRLRSCADEEGRRQLRQQGRLSPSRSLVRAERLRLPDDRHAAARRDRRVSTTARTV